MPLPNFDPARDFVVRARSLLCARISYVRGQPFQKATVTVRTLRQLYEQHQIDYPEALEEYLTRFPEPPAAPSAPEGEEDGSGPREKVGTKEERRAARAAADGAPGGPEGAREPDPRDAVVIPEGWRTLTWPQRRSLAASLTDIHIVTKEDAEAAIENEIGRREAAAELAAQAEAAPPHTEENPDGSS